MNARADISRLVRELSERTRLTQEKFAAKLGVTYPPSTDGRMAAPSLHRWH